MPIDITADFATFLTMKPLPPVRWQIIFILTVFCLWGKFTDDCFAIAYQNGPKTGDIPPPLTLTKTVQGDPATDISWDKLKGKVVVLEFWATWCGPCIKAIPHLNDLAEQFKGKPVVFISVTSENEDVVRFFLKKHPMKTWVGLDDYEVLNKAFYVQGIPHAVIVDAKGHIAAIAYPSDIKPEHLEEVLTGKKCSWIADQSIREFRHGKEDTMWPRSPK